MSDCDEEDRAFRRHSKPRTTVQKIDKVCLDYQNSTCQYGVSCRFLHPGGDEKNKDLTFCEDFRRGSCYNSRCFRLHANKIIEEEYRETGWLPLDLQQWVIEKYGICQKYLTDTCLRADDCKFQHISLGMDLKNVRVRKRGTHRPQSGKEYRDEGVHDIVRSCGVCKEFTQGKCSRGENCKFQHSSPMECGVGNNKTTWKDVWKREDGREEWENGPDRKRRMVDDGRDFFSGMVPNAQGGIGNNGMMRNMDGMSAMGNGMGAMGGGMMPNMGMAKPFEPNDQVWKLQNQLLDLKNENEELKKKIEGMRATNQFLLEENANIRMERMKEAEGRRSRDKDGLGRDRYGERGRDNYGTSRYNDTGTTRY